MTVRELKFELDKYDPDLEVICDYMSPPITQVVHILDATRDYIVLELAEDNGN